MLALNLDLNLDLIKWFDWNLRRYSRSTNKLTETYLCRRDTFFMSINLCICWDPTDWLQIQRCGPIFLHWKFGIKMLSPLFCILHISKHNSVSVIVICCRLLSSPKFYNFYCRYYRIVFCSILIGTNPKPYPIVRGLNSLRKHGFMLGLELLVLQLLFLILFNIAKFIFEYSIM